MRRRGRRDGHAVLTCRRVPSCSRSRRVRSQLVTSSLTRSPRVWLSWRVSPRSAKAFSSEASAVLISALRTLVSRVSPSTCFLSSRASLELTLELEAAWVTSGAGGSRDMRGLRRSEESCASRRAIVASRPWRTSRASASRAPTLASSALRAGPPPASSASISAHESCMHLRSPRSLRAWRERARSRQVGSGGACFLDAWPRW